MNTLPAHTPEAIRAIAPVIDQYGYLAVGGLLFVEDFGVPAPGETVLIAAAVFAGLGQLNIIVIIIIGIIAAMLGDNIGYGVGRFGGRALVLRFGKYVFVTPERLHKAEDLFRRQGGKIVIIARFIDGLRQLNGILAGISEMHWAAFLLYNTIGATIWVTFWALVGYFGGEHISTLLRYQLYATILVALAAATFIGYKIVTRNRKKKNTT